MRNAALAEVRRMIQDLHTDRADIGPLTASDLVRYEKLCQAERHLITIDQGVVA